MDKFIVDDVMYEHLQTYCHLLSRKEAIEKELKHLDDEFHIRELILNLYRNRIGEVQNESNCSN